MSLYDLLFGHGHHGGHGHGGHGYGHGSGHGYGHGHGHGHHHHHYDPCCPCAHCCAETERRRHHDHCMPVDYYGVRQANDQAVRQIIRAQQQRIDQLERERMMRVMPSADITLLDQK